MSSDKNPEVVGCDASIMKNVWEIRLRERDQKRQQEEERQQKSALSSINKEWADRLNARRGHFKRTERQTKSLDVSLDTETFWKGTQAEVRPPLSRGQSVATPSRPATTGSSRTFKAQSPSARDKKKPVQKGKISDKAQQLMSINLNEPSPMVWGRSWKYNKSLPDPEEAISEWGECWMFAMYQPEATDGNPWPNDPNTVDPRSLHIWEKQEHREVESEDLDLYLPEDEWEMSWRKSGLCETRKPSSVNEEDDAGRGGYFTSLLESQHHHEWLRLPEWSDSWRATKPSSQLEDDPVPDEAWDDESRALEQETTDTLSWDECWRLANLHGNNKPKRSQMRKPLGAEWVNSWRAATVVISDSKSSDCPPERDHSHSSEDYPQHGESLLHKIMLKSNEHKYRNLYQQLRDEFKGPSEWEESWEVAKNNSDPSEEIEKVLKVPPPKIEIQVEEEKWEDVDPKWDQLEHDIIYAPKRRHTQLQSMRLGDEFSFSTYWTDSWRTLKHRMRRERRRMRPDPMRPFGEREDRDSRDWMASNWTDSWMHNCQSLLQEPEFWEQGWSTTPQPRVNRALDPEHFAPVEHSKNGPTSEHSWGESWRSSRAQNRPQPRQTDAESGQRVPGAANWRHEEPSADWRASWMVSDSQFRHDTPSLVQWREAWRSSAFHADNWSEQKSRENWVDEAMEIQPARERGSVKLSRTFDGHMFRDGFPGSEWNTSWSGESLLKHQPSFYGSSGGPPHNATTPKDHASSTEHEPMWGMSFRLANPMPIVERPWEESPPNMSRHKVLWSKGRIGQRELSPSFDLNPERQRMWRDSHLLLQGPSSGVRHQSEEELSDPRVILTKRIETRGHLISNIEKGKQPTEKTFTGGHLLGKSQPRPKKPPSAVKKVVVEDAPETPDTFFEEWAESWRSLELPGGCKRQRPVRSLTGWDDSWKFLLPLYQMANVPKTK